MRDYRGTSEETREGDLWMYRSSVDPLHSFIPDPQKEPPVIRQLWHDAWPFVACVAGWIIVFLVVRLLSS